MEWSGWSGVEWGERDALGEVGGVDVRGACVAAADVKRREAVVHGGRKRASAAEGAAGRQAGTQASTRRSAATKQSVGNRWPNMPGIAR